MLICRFVNKSIFLQKQKTDRRETIRKHVVAEDVHPVGSAGFGEMRKTRRGGYFNRVSRGCQILLLE